MAEQWLILKDYADTLGISEAAVRKAIKTGRIPETALRSEKRDRGRPYVLVNKRLADISWYHNTLPTKGGPTSREAQDKVAPTVNGATPPPAATPEQPAGFINLNEATRREKVAKAAVAQLELLELQKVLVRRDVVYRELFEAGKQVREAIMGIPDRITDEVIAAGNDRHKVNTILTDALFAALKSLTEATAHKFN